MDNGIAVVVVGVLICGEKRRSLAGCLRALASREWRVNVGPGSPNIEAHAWRAMPHNSRGTTNVVKNPNRSTNI